MRDEVDSVEIEKKGTGNWIRRFNWPSSRNEMLKMYIQELRITADDASTGQIRAV